MQTLPQAGRASKMFKRRSARVQLRIPLTIEIGDEIVLEAETVTVSKHGAKIRITGFRSNQVVRQQHGKLACGDEMLVVNRAVRKSRKARIVWQDKRAEPHYGIELDDPGNFWGVYFPSKDDDWRTEKKAPQPAREAVFPSSAPAEVVTLPVADMPEAEGPAISALLTGITAARMPLAERVDVVFTRPDEACALLHHLVEPGANVRLILPDDRIMLGRVATVGGQRQAGKWRVRIKCEAQPA